LLVEDNNAAAMAGKLLLTRLHCLVDIANTGNEAVEQASANHYDLILMDLRLSDCSGIEAVKQIRALGDHPKSQVPIVAVTGRAGESETRSECLDAGMQDVLSKPVQLSSLQLVLQRFVSASTGIGIEESPEKKTTELTAIDWDACVQMCQGDAEFTYQMLSMLVEDFNETKIILAKAYDQQDIRTLDDELHRARGGVCYLKLPQLTEVLNRFHEAVTARPQDPQQVKATYVGLEQAIENFREALVTLKRQKK
jgi:CheY-like chemotaxis protein